MYRTKIRGGVLIMPLPDALPQVTYEPRHEKICISHMHPRSLIITFVVRYLDSIIHILAKSRISILVSVAEQAGLSWSETPKTVFLMTWLIWRPGADPARVHRVHVHPPPLCPSTCSQFAQSSKHPECLGNRIKDAHSILQNWIQGASGMFTEPRVHPKY